MKKKRIVAVMMVMVTVVLICVAIGGAREPRVAVGFVGYTNDVSGGRVARFAVSNLNGFMVRRRAYYWREELTAKGETNRVGGWF